MWHHVSDNATIIVCYFRALRDSEGYSGVSGVPAVEYCPCYLYVNFGPQGTLKDSQGLGLQLSSSVCAFCMSISGFRGF